MTWAELDRDSIIRMNEREFPPERFFLRWVSREDAQRHEEERRNILESLSDALSSTCKGSKPFWKALSPGCVICSEGAWSCLFINNLCNASCFFCPAPQNDVDEPGTSALTFPDPEEYADYIERMGFAGVSVSGGEPLMSQERTFSFLRSLKRRLGSRMYLWMYTNGSLLGRDTAKRLAEAGLDEIRINIASRGYDTAALRAARGTVPVLTVEIPAIPEDGGKVRDLLEDLCDLGVSHLNIHQIRCTPHNAARLMQRGYTFLHGPYVAVLESERAALEILRAACLKELPIGVNYCSAIYRHRYQTRNARRRWATLMKRPFEDITEAGLIRTVTVEGTPSQVGALKERIETHAHDPVQYQVSSDLTRMNISSSLVPIALASDVDVSVSYDLAAIRPCHSYRNLFKEIELDTGRILVVERGTAFPKARLGADELDVFVKNFVEGPCADPDRVYESLRERSFDEGRLAQWQRIIQAEALRCGLLEYY